MQDKGIIALLFRRDEAAISQMQTKYGGYCYQVAFNILSNAEDSEECVADTWMNAWNAIPPQRPNHLRLFLAKVTRNLAFNRYRAGRAQKRGGGTIEVVLSELEQCIPAGGDAADEVELRELQRRITRFVEELPERERNIFLRRYFYTESVQGIAKRYHLTPNNVSVILNRTRTGLKTQLSQEGLL